MYHKTNFGRFANHVERYADLNGYVPEAGDHWSKMEFDAATVFDADSWQEHVEAAVEAAVRAEQDVQAWQAEGNAKRET